MTSAESCLRAVTGMAVALFLSLSASYSLAQDAGCATPQQPPTAGGASVVQAATDTLQHKNWQPVGGEIQFTIKSFEIIPSNAFVLTCFRWKTDAASERFVEARPSRVELSNGGKDLKVTTTVPSIPPPGPGTTVKSRIPLVPLAEVRILAIKSDKTLAADVSTFIGVPYKIVAIAFAVATVVLALLALHLVAVWRLTHAGIRKANWMLRIISTPSGRASLSQLQIIVWTLVVAASAVYVMAASGELIQITTGTLVLLGIAGAAGIVTKAHNEAQGAAAGAAAEKAAADKAAAEKAPADQVPLWSDLVVNETVDNAGNVLREIDVARVQMLLFTVIASVFVITKVLVSYVIPDIPEGFQILMGISNGIYVGSKVVQKS